MASAALQGTANSAASVPRGGIRARPAPAAAGEFNDPAFVNSMLAQLPGVDPNDPAIQAALASINQGGEKKDDDAFVLAVVVVFGAFLGFPETRDVVLNNTQTVFYLVELLRDECAAIRDAADAALDVVRRHVVDARRLFLGVGHPLRV